MAYYSGQGRFYIADRNATTGAPGGFTALGNVTSLTIDIEIDKFEHKESMSGQRAVDLTILKEKKGTFTMTLEDFSLANLAMGFYGTTATVTGATATDENIVVMAADIGKPLRLIHSNVTSVTSVKIASTSYTVTTDYTVDLANGTITVVDGSTLDTAIAAGPATLLVTYVYGSYSKLDAFTQTSMEKWLRFEGLNTVTTNDRVIVDLYKVSLDPVSGYELINDEVGAVEISGNILFDDKRSTGDQFFRQVNYNHA